MASGAASGQGVGSASGATTGSGVAMHGARRSPVAALAAVLALVGLAVARPDRPVGAVGIGAPTGLTVSARDGAVVVTFTRPTLPAGAVVTNHGASFSRDGGATWTPWRVADPADLTSPVRFAGLTNGVSWRLRLRLLTNLGPGPSSAISPAFVPRPFTEIFVATTGSDANAGTRSAPLRTLSAAWARIPRAVPLAGPYTITMLAGEYAAATMPHYWEWRRGTAYAPITIRADGPGRPVTLRGDLNVFEVHFLTVRGLRIVPGGDALHCERCTHLTLDDVLLDGAGGAWETLKVNQSTDIVVRNSTLRSAGDNVVDFVAVRRGAITGNVITDGGDWCVYVKGGSSAITLAGNTIARCGTGGFTAGQGTGLEWMVAPDLTYEATDVVFRNNHITDTEGAAFGVNGGRDILIEGNRAERVGRRSHLIEVTFGGRSCDGNVPACAARLAQGAWGTAVTGGDVVAHIPDRDVVIRGNTIVNPAGYRSQWQHFEVSPPRVNPAGAVGPSPARTDTGLVITGNVIVNGDPSMPLGIDGSVVCTSANPTCTVAQILRDNDINGR